MASASLGVAGFTALAAVLRFSTLDAKSYWVDEVVTVSLVQRDLGSMLTTIPNSESTPPLYYVLAWLWAQLFGVGEVGMRSLPAALGTALVPVAYLAGRELISRAAGLASAALVAVNPLLVWYSQEARAYMLLALLGGLSFLFFCRSLRRADGQELAWWALASVLALASHYFALWASPCAARVAFSDESTVNSSEERRAALSERAPDAEATGGIRRPKNRVETASKRSPGFTQYLSEAAAACLIARSRD